MSGEENRAFCPGHDDFVKETQNEARRTREEIRQDLRVELKETQEKLTEIIKEAAVNRTEASHTSKAQEETGREIKQINEKLTDLAMSFVPASVCKERHSGLHQKIEEVDQDLRSLIERREGAIRGDLDKKTTALKKDYYKEREWSLKQKTKFIGFGGLIFAALTFVYNFLWNNSPQ